MFDSNNNNSNDYSLDRFLNYENADQ